MIDPEFYTMLPHSVTVQHVLTRDGWGRAASYGGIIVYRGRVVNKRRRVINSQGNEVISETTIYLSTPSGLLIDDYITMPSGCLPLNPPIISINRYPDEYGDYYTAIYV